MSLSKEDTKQNPKTTNLHQKDEEKPIPDQIKHEQSQGGALSWKRKHPGLRYCMVVGFLTPAVLWRVTASEDVFEVFDAIGLEEHQ